MVAPSRSNRTTLNSASKQCTFLYLYSGPSNFLTSVLITILLAYKVTYIMVLLPRLLYICTGHRLGMECSVVRSHISYYLRTSDATHHHVILELSCIPLRQRQYLRMGRYSNATALYGAGQPLLRAGTHGKVPVATASWALHSRFTPEVTRPTAGSILGGKRGYAGVRHPGTEPDWPRCSRGVLRPQFNHFEH